ncbi:hypothetical protein SGFS_077980 [Streptomyces graminofaciens]|uniref:Uncharacterized protein n=1 Tax=Streptomyces graminofaciens TaxID=68212 RepID=A0ABM7FJT1_9ACTN|nr:hypothetical protein SGFS_077980 [Streptomyces graminofaciens]
MLVPEVGQFAPAARVGFQVHFVEREPDMMAIGGQLLADAEQGLDVMVIDVAVMDGDWRQEVRTEAVERLPAALADACGLGPVVKFPPAARRHAHTLTAPDTDPRTTSTRACARHAESTLPHSRLRSSGRYPHAAARPALRADDGNLTTGPSSPVAGLVGQLPRHRRGQLGIERRSPVRPLPPRQRRVHRGEGEGRPRRALPGAGPVVTDAAALDPVAGVPSVPGR